MSEVIEINDLAELSGYRMAWNALLEETPRVSFFHTFDWLEAYWRHFGPGRQKSQAGQGQADKLRVLVVIAADKPVGIVPLVVRDEPRKFGTVRVLTYPLDNWGMWYSPIGGMQACTLWLAMKHIASTPRDWDMIDLPWIDRIGADRGRTVRAMNAAGLSAVERCDEAASIIDLGQGWESYLDSLCPKARQEIKRVGRRMSELGEVEHIRHRPAPMRYGDGDPGWDIYQQCEEIARESWQAESPDGNTLCHPQYQSFLREAHEAAARLGMVDVNVLRVNGQSVAFNYNYHHHGAVFGLRMGYRSDCEHNAIGAALLAMTLRDSIERGDQQFTLGTGDQPYKHRVRSGVEHNYRATHTPLTSWRSQAMRLGRWVRSRRSASGAAHPQESQVG